MQLPIFTCKKMTSIIAIGERRHLLNDHLSSSPPTSTSGNNYRLSSDEIMISSNERESLLNQLKNHSPIASVSSEQGGKENSETILKRFDEEEAAHNFTLVVVLSVVIFLIAPCFAFVPFLYMCKYKNSYSENAKAYYNISRAIIVIVILLLSLLVCMIAIPSSIGLSVFIKLRSK